jgi:hypothetical protein
MKKEIWKDIKGFTGYKVSNLGNVKSYFTKKQGFVLLLDLVGEGKLLKNSVDKKKGYVKYILRKNGKNYNKLGHKLIWDHFGDAPSDGMKLVVDHIDFNKTNNNIDNLQLITQRENASRSKLHNYKAKQCKYVGVSKVTKSIKFQARILIDGKSKHLGSFSTEIEAHNAYQEALEKIIKI